MDKQPCVIGCIVGTRPELIKMSPLIFKLKLCSWAKVYLINTAQQRGLLDDMMSLFDLIPDYDLNVMTLNQSLGALTAILCDKLDALVQHNRFDVLLAAGDTTTVFASSLIAFYHQIPFGHIEAGLRTYHAREPFPEEKNRILTATMAAWHFAPTELEKENLIRENIAPDKIIVTGNPVIDALYWVLKNKPDPYPVDKWPNSVIVTLHRRENFGESIKTICQAVIELSQEFNHLSFIVPVHPNPHVQQDIFLLLSEQPGIYLIPPLRYDAFAHLMKRSLLILTDSGGIQEEAPALGKPVVVLRTTTERPAIITHGVGVLVGTDTGQIITTVRELLTNKKVYSKMARGISPYGDGEAADRIIRCLQQHLSKESAPLN